MSEQPPQVLRISAPAAPPPAARASQAGAGVAARLAARSAALAGRLARLLAALPAAAHGPAAEGVAFLNSMAHDVPSRADAVTVVADDPFERLAEGLGLVPVERDLLLLAGLPEEHEGYGSVMRALHPRGEPRPSVGLCAQLLCEDASERLALRALLTSGAGVRSGAFTLQGEGPFFERSLLPAEELWPALLGLDAWPAALRPLPVEALRHGLEDWLDEPGARRARAVLRARRALLLLVLGETEDAALARAATLASEAGVEVSALALAAHENADKWIGLHALARGRVPLVRLHAPEGPGAAQVPAFAAFPGPVLIAARQGVSLARSARPVLALSAEPLAPSARRRVWSGLLPELGAQADVLAARYRLEPDVARDVARDVRALAALDGQTPALDSVAESVRLRCNLTLSAGVKLVHPRATWDQLVLPDDARHKLEEARERLMQQARVLDEWGFLRGRRGSRGVRLLLVGPPGTGKTLSAEVLACELGVDLLVVDVSRVVSKWIGETEKNLAEVFDAAERSQAVVLFDEADALYGKRTEVSDAHDRYANLETAYLLSRLERFDGLCVLASNLRQNIDQAFLRRLEFVVEFHEPGAAEREALWRAHLPRQAPLARDVDLRELSTLYPLVGALIRNASAAAAFLAASEGGVITRHHLVRAVRREYQKAGRAFPGLPPGLAVA